tara:strand:- start:720 stop:1472 length:753 start_codon:yes stop_codon:yes gene_type:complete
MIDVIYCISLERMNERRKRAITLLSSISLCPVYFMDAVDAKQYTMKDFNESGFFVYDSWKLEKDKCQVRMNHRLINFTYWQRPVTTGEVGCAVSHYSVWDFFSRSKYQRALILEADIKFEQETFLYALDIYAETIKNNQSDIFYLGCMSYLDGEAINNHVIECKFSYQLHSYIIEKEACEVLLNSGFENNLIAADEYVPSLYSEHPREDVRDLYTSKRKLIAHRLINNVIWQTDNIDGSQTAISKKEKFG